MQNTSLDAITLSASSGDDDWDGVNRNVWSEDAYNRLIVETEKHRKQNEERIDNGFVEPTYSSSVRTNTTSALNTPSIESKSHIQSQNDTLGVTSSSAIVPTPISDVATSNHYVKNKDIPVTTSNGNSTQILLSEDEKNDNVIHLEIENLSQAENHQEIKNLFPQQMESEKEQLATTTTTTTTKSRDAGAQEGKEEKDTFEFDDKDIQLDAADDYVALMVHISLAFFLLLFTGIIIGCVFVASTYGFVIFVALSLLAITVIFVGYYCVARVLLDDQTLKPARRKIKRWQAIATAVVVQEIRNFQMEFREHLLLTAAEDNDNGSSHSSDKTKSESTTQKKHNHNDIAASNDYQKMEIIAEQKKIKTKKSKSILFGFIKPMIPKNPKKLRLFRRKKKQQQQKNREDAFANVSDGYTPPITTLPNEIV